MTLKEWKNLQVEDYIRLMDYPEIFVIQSKERNIKHPIFIYEYKAKKINGTRYETIAYRPDCWKLLTNKDKIKLL